jgi:hypothetical protein
MKFIDQRMCQLVATVAIHGGRMDANHEALHEYSDDRPKEAGHGDDTFNLCFNAGMLTQVQVGDDDFVIELGS